MCFSNNKKKIPQNLPTFLHVIPYPRCFAVEILQKVLRFGEFQNMRIAFNNEIKIHFKKPGYFLAYNSLFFNFFNGFSS